MVVATILRIEKLPQLQNDTLHKFGNKTANVNIKNCSLSIVLSEMEQQQQNSLKGDTTEHHTDVQAM